jgi:multidrug efflux pump subunit AcrA (membrane-fusion protein)
MNLVGKIFVLLILVMSVVFMAFSVAVYATHRNWKDVITNPATGLKKQLDEANARVKNLDAINTKLQQEVQTEEQARIQALNKLRSEYTEVKRRHDELSEQLARLTTEARQALEAAQVAQKMLDDKLKEIDTLRSDIQQAHEDRDTRFKEAVALTDKLHESQGELLRLKAVNETVARTIAQYRDAAERKGVDLNEPVDNLPPRLDGKVLASRKNNYVEISLGEDDGLRVGHQAYIYRQHNGQSRPIAKISIVLVTPDKSVGQVIPEYNMAPIARDDRVVTRLN